MRRLGWFSSAVARRCGGLALAATCLSAPAQAQEPGEPKAAPQGEPAAQEEQEAVKAAGLRYFNIPVNYQQPTDAAVDEFLKITDDPANRPMFIHCTAAIRVGAFWMIRRVLRDGMTIDAAVEEARKVGMRDAPHLEQFARTYIAAHQKK